MARVKIMIVEDEYLIALDIKDTLEELGYIVCSLNRSGEEAIEKAKAEQPDLIFMDIGLIGKIDGIEAAKQIQNQSDIPEGPNLHSYW